MRPPPIQMLPPTGPCAPSPPCTNHVSSPDAERSPAVQQAHRFFAIKSFSAAFSKIDLRTSTSHRKPQPTGLRLPCVLGGRADAVLPPDLIAQTPGIRLIQNGHNWGLGKLRLPHGNLLAKRDHGARRFSFQPVSIEWERTM